MGRLRDDVRSLAPCEALNGSFCATVERVTSIVETERLKLREFSPGDLDELAAMVADEDQMRFYPRPKTRDEAAAWISRNLALYMELGYGIWLLESLPTSEFVGYCGIRPLVLEGDGSETEIGWHIRKTSWKQGIATEAAAAVRDVAFTRFGLSRLVAVIHPEHIASRRVAENIGMHPEQATVIGDYPALIYATARSQLTTLSR
jgi:RimJ/RimL family protein N-acetyltransferase